ncbi:MAG TPA: DUF4395 domain-containing protein [Thermomicrobiales bacterium]|nr:DUF4395 domain-containing protein [Thermomicrobiales bacterium]
MSRAQPVVDASALRVNQSLIVVLVALAFVLGGTGRWLILFVAASLALGAVWPGRGPFQLFYRHVLRRSGIIQPHPRPDEPGPHRFAQAVGGAFLLIAAIFLFTGVTAAGWLLAWLVAVLALVNLLFGFCAGCFAYYQFQRLRRQFSEGTV